MISWILVAAEIVAMFAIFGLLEKKPGQRKVLLWFSILSIPVGCLALYLADLAEEASRLMQALCFAVTLCSYLRYDHLPKKKKKK